MINMGMGKNHRIKILRRAGRLPVLLKRFFTFTLEHATIKEDAVAARLDEIL